MAVFSSKTSTLQEKEYLLSSPCVAAGIFDIIIIKRKVVRAWGLFCAITLLSKKSRIFRGYSKNVPKEFEVAF